MRTPSQTVGPFYSIGLCRRAENELVPPATAGSVRLTGQLLDGAGEPIVDGMIEVWDASGRRWGRGGTDQAGRFSFVVAEAPRLDVLVFARGLLKHQLTRIYFPGEPANATDPVLSALPEAQRETLIAREEEGELRFDIRMQGEHATVFFAA